jgi:hypothetical protein
VIDLISVLRISSWVIDGGQMRCSINHLRRRIPTSRLMRALLAPIRHPRTLWAAAGCATFTLPANRCSVPPQTGSLRTRFGTFHARPHFHR